MGATSTGARAYPWALCIYEVSPAVCFASLGSTTPLHFAATSGAADVARVLMAHGADESLADANGVSARDVATTTSVRAVIEAHSL